MRRRAKLVHWAKLLARICLLGSFTALLGLSATPLALRQAKLDYQRAILAGAPALAADSLERAASFFPWREDFAPAIVRYRLQAGDLAGAAFYLDRPQVKETLTGEDWLRLGEAYLASGDWQQAAAAWQQGAQASDPPLELYDRLHSLYLAQGDYAAAVEALRPTLLLRPDEPQRAYQLGMYLAVLNPEEALVYLELASQDAGLTHQADALQGTIRTASREGEPAYTHLQVGRQLASLGEWELAGEAFRQAVLARPDYAEAWALLAEARQQVGGDAAQALSELEQALKLKPESALVNSLFALYWERQGDPDLMVAHVVVAAESEPENATWQAEWGRALALTGDLAGALEHYQKAVQLAPEQALYLRLLAEFCLRYSVDLGNTGLPAARQALDLQPEDASILDVLAQVHLSFGNFPLAERFFRQAVNLQPEYAPAWLHLGALYLYNGAEESGRAMLLRAYELAVPGSLVADQAKRLLGHYTP